MKSVGQIFILCILKSITAIFFLNWITIPTPVLAQMQESFSDGNFTDDPPWTGSVDHFVVRDGELWLNATPTAGSASLATPTNVVFGTWEFRIHLGFNPSASNLARIYLISSSEDLSSEPDGYFVMIGETNDEVSLYARNGSSTVKIIDGTDRRVDATSVTLTVKVSHSASGQWRLMTKTDTESEFQSEGTANHEVNEIHGYFGFECVYTSTRSDKFSFDDITISKAGNNDDDNDPPTSNAHFKDVIITEIFADPSPPVGLPEIEFVEIYNRSDKTLQLEGWTLSDPSSNGTLANHLFPPHSYAILAGAGSEQFTSYGDVVNVKGFPSLNNAGDALVLRSDAGEVIDSLTYANWYHDTAKQSGGWTLELIDPENICAESENWAASESPLGGTPGQQNSILAEKPDLTGPQLIAASPVAAGAIALRFNEKLSNRPLEKTSFTFTNNLAAAAAHLAPDKRTVHVTTTSPIENGVLYHVTAQDIYDCPGNPVQPGFNTAEFALPESADSLDVVVNEILFNPRPGGVDFVEIINRSSKYLALSSWKVARMKDGVISDAAAIPEHFQLLKPGEIRAFTSSVMTLENEYINARNRGIVEMKLPPFNDDAGSVAILNSEDKIIDLFYYTEDMHSGFVRDPDGVSLERLSSEQGTDDPSNWKSAASHSGFATPGYENSNLVRQPENGDRVTVNPEAFVPIIGQPDFTIISYDLDSPGMMGTITILDFRGRVVRRLVQNSMLGSNGFFRWDGDTDEGGKARIGLYMIRFDLYDKAGLQESILKRVAIAGNY